MKNLNKTSSPSLSRNLLLLVQFFLIIFVYHTMKDVKDTVVITASSAGAEVIPFIKIWGILPAAIGASYFFAKVYRRFDREKTLYIFAGLLGLFYLLFAFILYPLREELYLSHLDQYLNMALPKGCRGFIAMVCFWHFTLFYIAAELWSVLILSILFWGYVNETTTLSEAKKFYPLCMFTGNFAGIFSGQISHYISHHLREYLSWQETLQIVAVIVAGCCLLVMGINRWLHCQDQSIPEQRSFNRKPKGTFKDNLISIFRSGPLLCIAILVIGFGLTSNLIEVLWKENIRILYPDPQAFNAYINQVTSWVGLSAVCMALISRWMFQFFSWGKIALITPVTLFSTSFLFFSALFIPSEYLSSLFAFLKISPIFAIVALGSIHYVLGMTAKYTIFDTCKEMAFLSIDTTERMKAKSVIDSMGSRLGKTGASCLYQFLLVACGSASAHLSVIGATSLFMIGISIAATNKLDIYLKNKREGEIGMDYTT